MAVCAKKASSIDAGGIGLAPPPLGGVAAEAEAAAPGPSSSPSISNPAIPPVGGTGLPAPERAAALVGVPRTAPPGVGVDPAPAPAPPAVVLGRCGVVVVVVVAEAGPGGRSP